MKRFAMTSVIAAFIILAFTSPSSAQYQTPGGASMLVIQPVQYDVTDVASGPIAAAIWNHYSWSKLGDDSDDNYPDVLMTDVDEALRARLPILDINSHGGNAVYGYSPNASGQAAMTADYNRLVPSVYSPSDVFQGTITDPNDGHLIMYAVGFNTSFVKGRYNGNRSIVVFTGCASNTFRSAFRSPSGGQAAAAFLAYDNPAVLNTTIRDECNAIFYSMSGGNGVSNRPIQSAVAGKTIKLDPVSPNLVMSPRVKFVSLTQGAHFSSAQTLYFDFDTPMKTTQVMSDVVRCEGNVSLDNNSVIWSIGNTRLQGTLRGLAKGSGTVVLTSYNPDDLDLGGMMSDTGIGLDGNTNPSNDPIGGVEPAGDDYRLNLVSDYADNPAAVVSGFTAVRENGTVTGRWVVESEHNTDHYVVEHAADPSGLFVPVAEVIANGSNVYTATLLGLTDGFCRLREVETDGDTLTHAYASVEDPQPVGTDVVDETAAATLLQNLEQRYPNNQPQSVETSYTDIVYTPVLFQSQSQILANYKNSRGISTAVVTLESIGGAANVKADIAARVPSGARNFLKIGDGNDDRDARGTLVWNNPAFWDSGYVKPGGSTAQPGNNVFPVAEYRMIPGPQALSQPYWQKNIASDWSDIDLDGDGLPDPGLSMGRLPGATSALITNAVNKQIAAYQINPANAGVNHVFVFTYAFDVGGNSGASAIAYTDSVVTYLPNSLVIDRFVDKPTAWYTDARRDSLCVAQFNKGSALQIYKSTVNNRYHNAGCLDQDRHANLGTMASNQYRLPFLYVSACGGGDFDRTELDSVGRPLNERLLMNRSDLGCWGYFGPTRGTWQHGNHLMDSQFLSQLYMNGAHSVGQAASLAVYKLAMQHPEFWDLALSYTFIGDPSVPLPFMRQTNVGVEDTDGSQRLAFAPPYPNPSPNRMTTFRFSLPQSSRVTFTIVDVAGRRVVTLVDGSVRAGVTTLQWDATDHSGARVPSGMYFAHLQVGSEDKVQKMVVLH